MVGRREQRVEGCVVPRTKEDGAAGGNPVITGFTEKIYEGTSSITVLLRDTAALQFPVLSNVPF